MHAFKYLRRKMKNDITFFIKVKVTLRLRGGVEVYLYSLFNFGARWGASSTLISPGRFTPGKELPIV
jgi:hypothetical protein